MATLTPGVLLKLLQSMNSDSKPFGEHRSAILQVTGIVPASSSTIPSDDLWPSHGFYLQLSDSIHSTYVSLSDRDADLIVSNHPQLGQLVHLDRLYFDLPVPRATGLRPISSPRHCPFLGSPQPLIAISSSHAPGFVIQPASPSTAASTVKPRSVLVSKENFFPASSKNSSDSTSISKPKRRFSSPASRNPCPAPDKQGSRGISRAPSPVPSKCEVPSLVAAKEENRKPVREPAIVVPSRYRQPSPVGRKAIASPVGRKGSGSPGIRRLSSGLKFSPAVGDGSGKRKPGLVVTGISRVSDALAASGRLARRSWDDNSSSSESSSTEIRENGGSRRKEQPSTKPQVITKCQLSAASMDKTHNEEESTEEKQPASMIDIAVVENPDHMTQKVTVYDRKWTDGSISFDSVSQKLARLGKDAIERRNIASKAAADALEEALATESIIRSLSMFSDLCLTSKNGNPLQAINNFLSIYNDVVKGTSMVSSLVARRTENTHVDALSINTAKSVSLWVEAALRTDLEVLNLINSSTLENDSKLKGSERIPIPCADFPKSCIPKRSSHANRIQPKSSSTHCSAANIWTLELAEFLRNEMQLWFLNFMEGVISVGFFLFGDKEASFKDNNRVAAVVFHLKCVNDWIDVVFAKSEDEILRGKIEQVRQKIYNFVMNHMGLMKPISNSRTEVDDGEVFDGMGSTFNRALSLGNS